MYGIDYGIDTVRLGIPFLLNGDSLMRNGWISTEEVVPAHPEYHQSKRTFHIYRKNIGHMPAGIKMVFYPQDPEGEHKPIFLVETSLPIRVYGNNIRFLNDPMEGIEKCSTIISRLPELPKLDLSKAILHRLDLACNFQVNDYVGEYIHQLFKLTYPKRRTKPYYPTQGVQYYSGSETLIFYDKEEECEKSAAAEILRMEDSAVDKRQVGMLVGTKDATIQTLTPDLIYNILDNEMRILGIKDKVFTDPSSALRDLIHAYGIETATRLYGFLQASQTNDHKQLALLGFKPDVISRNEKLIREAGLSMAMTDSDKPLPVLKIDR